MSSNSTEPLPISTEIEDKQFASQTNLNGVVLRDLSVPKKRGLLLRIIPLVYKCGGTAHLTQVYIDKLCKILDLEATVSFLPGRILLTWPTSGIGEEELSLPHVSLLNVAFALQCRWGFQLSTLQNLADLIEDMHKNVNSILVGDVIVRLTAIEKEPLPYGKYGLLLGFGFMAAPMAPAFFGGSLLDGAVTLLIGSIAGVFALLSDSLPTMLLPFHEVLCSFVCALLAIFFSVLSHGTSQPISFWPVILASNIWILPGFSLVIATIDILSKAGPAPGFIMLFGCCFIAIIMGISYSVAIWVTGVDPNQYLRFATTPELKVDLGTSIILVCLFAIACCLIYQTRRSQWILAIVSTVFCFLMIYLFEEVLAFPDELVHFASAFSLGIFMRSTCKAVRQIPEAAMYCAMLPLVPGSRIVRAAFALLAGLHKADCSGANTNFYRTLLGSIIIGIIVSFGLLMSEIVFEKIIMRLIKYPETHPTSAIKQQPQDEAKA
ncbi:pheromone-regulated protein prm10 [Mitosporidium daphniae]|uniref:Threonine/serine exporter-like N-terminal domain-containing protein n=1 Tax=Mitosporidium daphniae TaxID=1485682 RepID=A0A098VPZ0_9MICR|nr:uncharacterized protein DI09_52p70 [Mitosporidium daphniae]KGG50854.1 hypothetical protein DI09_52p70 [Mitosporidium daphniae]|eukprot:XP_013237305.1 uncharacterized protein DI09_52p70 [Mitosporidium daphniae]